MKINIINNISHTQYGKTYNNKKQTNLTFGHYLDEEKRSKEARLSSLNSEIASVEYRIWSDNQDYERESSSLDYDIDRAESAYAASESKADKLRSRADSKESYIDSLSSEGYRLQQKANNNLQKIKQLETEKQNTIKRLQTSNTTLQNTLADNFKTVEANLKTNVDNIKNGLKSNLIQNVINPIIENTEGKENTFASSLYIENNSGNPEPIFSWLVKQTDSNYAKIDSVQFSDKKQVISILKKVCLLASRSYEETGKTTFTLLAGLDNLIAQLIDTKGLQDLLSCAAQLYHNVIVSISQKPYSQIAKTLQFEKPIQAEKTFATDKLVGETSFIDFISKHQYTGEDLLSKVIKR